MVIWKWNEKSVPSKPWNDEIVYIYMLLCHVRKWYFMKDSRELFLSFLQNESYRKNLAMLTMWSSIMRVGYGWWVDVCFILIFVLSLVWSVAFICLFTVWGCVGARGSCGWFARSMEKVQRLRSLLLEEGVLELGMPVADSLALWKKYSVWEVYCLRRVCWS